MTTELTLHDKLVAIQNELKVPKGQRNGFGNYNYRSIEDIETAVKPLLKEYGLTLIFSDQLKQIGDKNYVQSCASLSDGTTIYEAYGYAREADSQKGMVDAQLTGSTSSYARKYAAGGLFLIDDTKDADATNDHGKSDPKPAVRPKVSNDATTQAVWDAMTQDAPTGKARDYDNSGVPASSKQLEYITGMGVKIGKRSKEINEEYGIEWPNVSRNLANIIIEDFKAVYDPTYKK